MDVKVRDKLWLWGHEAGSHNSYNLPGQSRMTPAEAAFYLGIPNLIMVKYCNKPAPPYEQYALPFRPLKNVVWSIVGESGCSDTEEEVSIVKELASGFPNISGVIMDDFFRRKEDADGNRIPGYTPEELAGIKNKLVLPDRNLDLWVVLYDAELNLPLREHLKQCDVVTFWTWTAENLKNMEQNFRQAEEMTPSCRKVLGCYMYDYGAGRQMSLSLMEYQCTTGLQWLRDGRIDGMIFLASCICDLNLEAVEWTRRWIATAGNRPITDSAPSQKNSQKP